MGRMVVSGHAPNVGIVGWSLGGGHGQLVPMHGSGVDQVNISYFICNGDFAKIVIISDENNPVLVGFELN